MHIIPNVKKSDEILDNLPVNGFLHQEWHVIAIQLDCFGH